MRIEAQTVMSAPHISLPGACDSMLPLVQSICALSLGIYGEESLRHDGTLESAGTSYPRRIVPLIIGPTR